MAPPGEDLVGLLREEQLVGLPQEWPLGGLLPGVEQCFCACASCGGVPLHEHKNRGGSRR